MLGQSNQEAEALWVQGQPGIYIKTLSLREFLNCALVPLILAQAEAGRSLSQGQPGL